MFKLAWVSRSTPGLDKNPYVHPKVKYELDAMVRNAKKLMEKDTPIYIFFEEVEREFPNLHYHHYTSSISFHVDTGDEAKEILKWFSGKGYRVTDYNDDENTGSRDYSMQSRDRIDDLFGDYGFIVYMYFKGTCSFQDTTEVARIEEAKPAVAEKTIYKKVLVCKGETLPTGV